MRALFISDLHLETWLKYGLDSEGSPRRFRDYLKFFEAVLTEAETVDKVVFFGDLFRDKHRINTKVYAFAYTAFKTLSSVCPEVIMIAGNHDIYENVCTFYGFPAKIILKPTVETWDGCKVALLPYSPKVGELKDADIALGHFALCDSKCKARDSEIKVKDLAKYQRVFLGHEHKAQQINNITILGASLPNTFADLDVVPSYHIFTNMNLEKKTLPLSRFVVGTSSLDPAEVVNNYVRITLQWNEDAATVREKYKEAAYLDIVYQLKEVNPEELQQAVAVKSVEDLCKEYAAVVLADSKDVDITTLTTVLKEVLTSAAVH